MTCRHEANDPRCSANKNSKRAPKALVTPDASNYEVDVVERIGNHLVMRVRYPNCNLCEFEGEKVMVFLNVSEAQALKWKRIDPHFRRPGNGSATEAPGPAARFPATTDGWLDAICYARGKVGNLVND